MQPQLHVLQELDDETEYDDVDLVNHFRESRVEIQERMQSIRSDIDTTVALEDLSTSIIRKEFLTKDDVDKYNYIVENNNNYDVSGFSFKQVSLESFETLARTGSAIAKTATNIANASAAAASAIKNGAVASAQFAMFLYDKIKDNITKIAASFDIVCSLIEKRWLGLTQLVQVYELQHKNLLEKFEDTNIDSSSVAFFKVKLYVAKLRNDGRDITKKEELINSIESDSSSFLEMVNAFSKMMFEVKSVDSVTTRALTLREPYKKSLCSSANIINHSLKELTKNAIFTDGGFVKDYQAQSRVLMGGKVVYINYNADNLAETSIRKETKAFISNMNFSAVKRRDGTTNDTETVEFSGVNYREAISIFDSVRKTNEALRFYHDSNIPKILKNRQAISSLITFATGLTGGNAAFDTIKRFFNNDENLKAFNLVAPAGVAKLLGTFLGASSFAVFGGLVAASAAAFLIDYLRKYIIANVFSMMDLQYKITDIMERFDHDYVDALIEIHNQGYRVCKKLASSRNWEK